MDSAYTSHYAFIKNSMESFDGFYHSHVKREDLCQAGFYYTGVRDYVKCFFCNPQLKNWADGDIPWFKHKRWANEKCKDMTECQKSSDTVKSYH